MAASLPAVLAMTLFFALLFWAFIPGNLMSIPSNGWNPFDSKVSSSGDKSQDNLVHAVLFAVVLTLTYEVVANFIYKNV